ncbi:type III PLP-dependent enzyme domain-containing protein [Mycolicibacterium baixiangningiae]|uniref:hypothetical protein n=1 Tax=Mycolicibacterium baixiangningiae TaxID=2761578 RepID=UPI001865B9F8|nr:hypothetical protein [Mycolicibacterium baixiangningiae]
MTTALAQEDTAVDLGASLTAVRRVLPSAGYGVTATDLIDRGAARWVRAHGVSVFAQNEDDLEVLARNSIRPVQVVLRCGSTPETIRRAVNAGVSRFVVCTAAESALLAEFAHRTKYIYLGGGAPVPVPHRRLQVIGLHCEVDDSSGRIEWADATERMLCRLAYLRSCALRPVRLTLTGRPTPQGRCASAEETSLIASAVRDALDEGCHRWRLNRPKVLLGPGRLAGMDTVAA